MWSFPNGLMAMVAARKSYARAFERVRTGIYTFDPVCLSLGCQCKVI